MPPSSPRSFGVHNPYPTSTELVLLFGALLIAAATTDAQASRPSRQYIGPKVGVLNSIAAFKQTAPGVGWVIADERLLWTASDGAVWTDITPPGATTDGLSSVYALDSQHLWAARLDTPGEWEERYPWRLLRTTNAGQTWSTLQFDAASFPKLKKTHAQPRELFFVDPDHGWFLWRSPTGTQVSIGILLSTKNGGRTWKELPWPPSAHGVIFYTARDGWTTGQPDGTELWVTHDAGQSWTQKSVPPPDSCKDCRPIYDIPRFRSLADGVVAITFADDTNADGRYVNTSYVTHDGGNSWQAIDVFEKNDPYPGNNGSSCEVDMDVVRVFSDQEHGMRIRTAAGAIEPPYPEELPPRGLTGLIDFVDLRHGWLQYGSMRCVKFPEPGVLRCQEVATSTDLLSTSDGGRTFKVISPTSKPTH